MKLIVGLGNPGKEYQNTRHNAGFLAVDLLLAMYGFDSQKTEFNAEVFTTKVNDEKVFFMKPLTFMNNSGQAVSAFMNYYKISEDSVLIIYDEKDFGVGKTQFKYKGSSAGHNGIKSLIQYLGNQDFKRLRVGIGQPNKNYSLVDWVLSRFSQEELTALQTAIAKVDGFVDDWTKNESFDKIMSKYNLVSETKGE